MRREGARDDRIRREEPPLGRVVVAATHVHEAQCVLLLVPREADAQAVGHARVAREISPLGIEAPAERAEPLLVDDAAVRRPPEVICVARVLARQPLDIAHSHQPHRRRQADEVRFGIIRTTAACVSFMPHSTQVSEHSYVKSR